MAEKQTVDGRYTFTTAARMVFGNLIEPKAVGAKGKAKGDPKYSGTFIEISEADLKAAKSKAAEVARARWPGRDLKELKFPFTLGEKKIEREAAKAKKEGRAARDQSFFNGQVILDARSKYPPRLAVLRGKTVEAFDGDKRPLAKDKFYNGCYVVPQINFVAYDGQSEDGVGNPDGVTAYLDAVLWTKDGVKIGGVSTADIFKGYAGTVTDSDPGSDDEIAF